MNLASDRVKCPEVRYSSRTRKLIYGGLSSRTTRVDLKESLTRFRDLGERRQTTSALEICAGLAAAQVHQGADAQLAGRRAAQLFGAAEALREALGAPLLPIYRDHYQRGVSAARALLDEATFATAWATGRAMPLELAIAEALA